jgi:hypothetical protein
MPLQNSPFLIAARERARKHGPTVLALAATGYLMLLTFPNCNRQPGYGLDISWQYALNALKQTSFRFGTDTNFTYGPLGYLLFPMNLGSNLVYGFIFALLLQLLFGGFALSAFLKEKSTTHTLLATFALAACFSLLGWPEYENRFFTVFWLGAAAAHGSPRTRRLWLACLGALAGVGLFAKFSIGLSSLIGLTLLHGVFLVEKIADRRAFFLAPTALLTVVLWQFATHFQSVAGMWTWGRTSLEISSGYTSAMSLVGPSHQVLWCAICLAAYALFTAFLYWRAAPQRHLALIAVPQLFFLFKSAVVRQDGGHLVIFFCTLPALPVALAVFATTRAERIAAWTLFSVFFVFDALVVNLEAKAFDSLEIGKRLATIRGIENVGQGLEGLRQPPSLPPTGPEAARLPEDWLERIRRERGTVGVLPWEISLIQSNQLDWKPNAVLQQYCVFTSGLDRLNAEHFSTPGRAPDFLIVDFPDIDGRYPFWSGPATWRAVMLNYDVAGKTPTRILLKRRAAPVAAQWRELGKDTIVADKWIDVPSGEGPVFAAIDFETRFVGMAAGFFFRIPPTYIEAEYENGERHSFRLIPGGAKEGILISSLPYGENAGTLFERNFSTWKVRKFRVTGPGIAEYRISPLVWKELTVPATSAPSPPR